MKSNEAINAFLTPGYDTRLNASRLLKEAGAGLPFGRIVKGQRSTSTHSCAMWRKSKALSS